MRVTAFTSKMAYALTLGESGSQSFSLPKSRPKTQKYIEHVVQFQNDE